MSIRVSAHLVHQLEVFYREQDTPKSLRFREISRDDGSDLVVLETTSQAAVYLSRLYPAHRVDVGFRYFLRSLHRFDRERWSALSLFEASPLLQDFVASQRDSDFSPEQVAKNLIVMRTNLAKDIAAHLQGHAGFDEFKYPLSLMARAVCADPSFSGMKSMLISLCGAWDLYDRSRILRNRGLYADEYVNNTPGFFDWILSFREALVKEQNDIDPFESAEGAYSLGYVVQALFMHNAIGKKKYDLLHRKAYQRDLYERSPSLQGISNAYLSSPLMLIYELDRIRDDVIEEVKSGTREHVVHYALSSLVYSLITAGRIPRTNEQKYVRLAGALEMYRRSETLQNIPEDILNDDKALIKYLVRFRDKISIECMLQLGKATIDKWFVRDVEWLSLATLLHALYAGRKITSEKRWLSLVNWYGTKLDYYLHRRKNLDPDIAKVKQVWSAPGKKLGAQHIVDRKKFTATDDPERPLSLAYFQAVVSNAVWLNALPDGYTRTLLSGAEMAASVGMSLDLRKFPNIEERLMRAAVYAANYPQGARREAVLALAHLREELAAQDVSPQLLDGIDLMIEGNHDAIPSQVQIPQALPARQVAAAGGGIPCSISQMPLNPLPMVFSSASVFKLPVVGGMSFFRII